MKIGMKKLIVSLLIMNYLLASSCPNMCSGHGSCGKGGVCSCFPGWIDGDCSSRTCPYGHSFVDPTTTPGNYGSLTGRASLECSGQGTCDRTSGSCKCFGGFEGVSCDRMSCPSNCNGHGVCTAVKMIDLNEDSHIGSYYENDMSKITTTKVAPYSSYDGWDADQSYVCVCDGEYSGFDCSEKKCPTGYVENSDCDSPSKSTQTITIEQDGTATTQDCMAYLEYTDQYNRIWYSDAFCVTCESKEDTAANNRGNCGGNGNGNGLVLGWQDALLSLPVGVIDVSANDIKLEVTPVGGGGAPFKVTTSITFGSQQTGKQNPIRIITSKELGANSKMGSEWCGDCGSGYHGMTNSQLKLKVNGDKIETDATCVTANECYLPLVVADGKSPIVATVEGIPPLECSRNGLCDRSSGLCKCFEGYYGIACTEQASML